MKSQTWGLLVICFCVVGIILVLFLHSQQAAAQDTPTDQNAGLVPLAQLSRTATQLVWTTSTDGSGSTASLITSRLTLRTPTLLVLECCQGGVANAVYWDVWTSETGIVESTTLSALNEFGQLAQQASEAIEILQGDEEGSSPHAFFLRGRWFFVGAAAWPSLAWSPLCGGYPLEDVVGAAAALKPAWMPVVASSSASTSQPKILLTSADSYSSAALMLDSDGDLCVRSGANGVYDGGKTWSAAITSRTNFTPPLVVGNDCRV